MLPPDPIELKVKELLSKGEKTEAIKFFKESLGLSFQEAKSFIENLENDSYENVSKSKPVVNLEIIENASSGVAEINNKLKNEKATVDPDSLNKDNLGKRLPSELKKKATHSTYLKIVVVSFFTILIGGAILLYTNNLPSLGESKYDDQEKTESIEEIEAIANEYLENEEYNEAILAYRKIISLREKPKSLDYFSLGRAYFHSDQFVQADLAFTKLIEMQPDMVVGYSWEAKTKISLEDPNQIQWLAKPYFEKLVELANPDKDKVDLINAYDYLAQYYYNTPHFSDR